MTRELKLALIVGFSLVLIVTVLISDHLSKARRLELAGPSVNQPVYVPTSAEPPVAMVAQRDQVPLIGIPDSAVARRPEPAPVEDQPVLIPQGTGHGIPVGPAAPAVARGDVQPIREPVIEKPAERVYVVAETDSLFKIARQVYGDGNQWPKLAEYNKVKPEALKVGMKLRIPGDAKMAVKPAAQASSATSGKFAIGGAAESSNSKYTSYTVRKGDTLTGISRRMLGSPQRTADLIRLNGLDDEEALTEGATIKIPVS